MADSREAGGESKTEAEGVSLNYIHAWSREGDELVDPIYHFRK
jgi:hypothetical protein